MFDPGPGANDWYDVPKKTCKVFFTEPYNFPIDGEPVLMAPLVAPILVGDKFQGVASADFALTQLGKILANLNVIQSGQLALVSNGGLYASHPNAEQVNKKAEDIPEVRLEAIKKGQPYEYRDKADQVHLIQPVVVQPDTLPWAVRISFPHSVATASARQLTVYTLAVAVVVRLMKPLRALSDAMTGLAIAEIAQGNHDLSGRTEHQASALQQTAASAR